MSDQNRMDPEMLSMVLDTIDKLEKEKISEESLQTQKSVIYDSIYSG